MAAETKMTFHRTVAANLHTLPVVSGQLIFVADTKQIYFDSTGNRIEYSCIQSFAKDSDRLAVHAPTLGYYFVEETAILWRYNQKWIQITPDNLNQITFGSTVDDFPKEGNDKLLYIADDATYKWDSVTRSYMVVANKTEWKTLT